MIGKFVSLEPMTIGHVDALAAAGLYPELWTWIPTPVTTAGEMRTYVETALADRNAMPFVIIDRESTRVIGSTRYANISAGDRRVEIGWTWITPAFQRTPANTETKLLMLTHAFEVLGCARVEPPAGYGVLLDPGGVMAANQRAIDGQTGDARLSAILIPCGKRTSLHSFSAIGARSPRRSDSD